MRGLVQRFRVVAPYGRHRYALGRDIQSKLATVALGIGFPLCFKQISEKSFVFYSVIHTSPVVLGSAVFGALFMGSGTFGKFW